MSDTRMPTQKRSIEKRNRIIEKGFELMCEKGYYNVSTPDIAEVAEVSTGIIYQYFNDKKDIFMEGVKNYSNSIMFPMHLVLENEDLKIDNIETVVKRMIEAYIKSHTISKKAHEELMAMSHLDEDVSNIFKNSELELTNKIVSIIKNNNIKIKNPIAAGVGIGTSSHAMGTSKAVELGEIEGAMSGISIGVAGILTVLISMFL